jgi:hypothetical protein
MELRKEAWQVSKRTLFDVWGIILMIIAVALGQFIGGYLTGYLGSLGGGIVGSLLIGIICYVIYMFLSGGKWSLMGAILFTVLIYVANMIAAYVDSAFGLGGGVLTLVITGFLASLLWGWVGGRGKASKTPKLGKL